MAKNESEDSATLNQVEIDALVGDYLKQISKVAPLTIDLEVDLVTRMRAGIKLFLQQK